jgi:hypothetical protein
LLSHFVPSPLFKRDKKLICAIPIQIKNSIQKLYAKFYSTMRIANQKRARAVSTPFLHQNCIHAVLMYRLRREDDPALPLMPISNQAQGICSI